MKKILMVLGAVILMVLSIFTGAFIAKSKNNSTSASSQPQIQQQNSLQSNGNNNNQGKVNSEGNGTTQIKNQDNNAANTNTQTNTQQSIEDVKNSIVITSAYPSEPNSAGGVDLNIVWKNVSSKVIKYVNFEVVPYNAVNDIVESSIGGKSEAFARVTGPIQPNETYGDDKVWKCAWYNNTIRTIQVIGVEVIYMDGTSVKIDKDQVKYIIRGHGN